MTKPQIPGRARTALAVASLALAVVAGLAPDAGAQTRRTVRIQSMPRLAAPSAARPSLLRRAFTRRQGARLGAHATDHDLRAVPTEPHLFARTALAPGEHLPAAYHANAVEAATGFAHWLHDAPAVDGPSLRAATEAMHQTSAIGRGATPRPYNAGRYASDAVHPGQLRGEGELHYNRPGALAYAQRVAGNLRVEQPTQGLLSIRGIGSDEELPMNLGSRHFYPPSRALDHYFASAAHTLQQLRAVPLRAEARGAADDLIADYYHTMVNARPFDQINNSLVMNQVNLLLRERGELGVSHGHLDFLAHHLGPTAFRAAFRAHLAGQLPSPAQLGVERLGR